MDERTVVTGVGVAVLTVAVGVAWWALVTGGFGELDAGLAVGVLVALVGGLDSLRRRGDDDGERWNPAD